MDQVTVRPATLDDMQTLLAFEQAMIASERPFDAAIQTGEGVRYYDLEAMISSFDVQLLVAEIDSKLVASGYARIETSKAYLNHRRHSYLGFMYVVPEHRGRGINQKIIGELEAWSHSRGVTELRLEVYVENIAAVRAYEKSRYSTLTATMHKRLSDK